MKRSKSMCLQFSLNSGSNLLNPDDDDYGSDEEDDESEVEEAEEDDAFTFEASERNAILTSRVRKYVVPKINFKATSYTQLIDLQKPGITEPALTLSMSDAQILQGNSL